MLLETPDTTPTRNANRLLRDLALLTGNRWLLAEWGRREWERVLRELPPLADDEELPF